MKQTIFLLSLSAFGVCLSTATAQSIDVYVGGRKDAKAVVWKNETPIYLTTDSKFGEIASVVVDKGKIYALGYHGYLSRLWIDGTEKYIFNELGYHTTTTRDIAVSGNNVYVVGDKRGNAPLKSGGVVWKNGIAEDGYDNSDWFSSIFIDGSDIYVVGCTYGTIHQAALWKNGNLIYTLTAGRGTPYSVFVSDGDVYTIGSEQTVVTPDVWVNRVWKNGTILYTIDKGNLNGLYISNGDIYIAGDAYNTSGNKVARLWKNGGTDNGGTTTDLVEGPYSSATSVFVLDNDVYVAGSYDDENGKRIILFWKNGEPKVISNVDGDNLTTSIYVVKSGVGLEEGKSEQSVRLCPNPTNGKLKIESGDLQVEKVEILDITGRTVLTSHETTLNISQFSAGTYFVKLKTETGELTKKVIKE